MCEPESLVDKAQRGEIDVVFFTFRNQFVKEAAALFKGISGVQGYMLPTHATRNGNKIDANSFVAIDFTKPRLKQFDVNVADHCNMKCKGCLRYSNIVETPFFADYERMIKDWKRIKELFWGVERVKLMGGEPLLNPDLGKYVKKSREIFPDADIMVTTNALLISDKIKDLFEIMKDNNVFFDISLYKPMEDHEDRLREILERNNVWYEMNYSKGNFYKIRSVKPIYDPDEMYERCAAKNCHHLREGKLSVCSAPQYACYMNERFGTSLPENDGVYDIYNLDMDSWELDKCLSRSFESCRYCAPPVEFKWDRADAKTCKMSDWFVEEKNENN